MTKGRIVELFTYSVEDPAVKWLRIIENQNCRLIGKPCYKTRKSDPSVAIGTCTVRHGKSDQPVIICPSRLLERRQIFVDCLHLLTSHQPGNELHIIPEVSIPGGSVDFFLVSVRRNAVVDFVGIELQTMDTTGTVWPERQKLLRRLGVKNAKLAAEDKPYGINWKMTAKTILVQMHHKIHTFEHVQKRLVLVVQDRLLHYMAKEFNFTKLNSNAVLGDSMHFHAYQLDAGQNGKYNLSLASRMSTGSDGIASCLGLQAEAKIELQVIVKALADRVSASTLFSPV